MKRTVIAALLGALTLGPVVARATAAPAPSAPASDVVEDADWTLSAQLPDGAIAHYTDKHEVWPYLANFAAMGLARAAEVTSDGRYSEAAWRWLSWYQAHQDANGYVTDYVVNADGSLTSKGDMDSTDAYAGTFLLAARRTFLAKGDQTRLRGLAPALVAAVRAIASTQDTDGLTWAKPSWKVKYLMDQAEVYAGLRAAADLARVLGDQTLRRNANAAADRVAAAVSGLWNPSTSTYDWAQHESGARETSKWATFYPDAQEQMWAVAFGLTDAARGRDLVARFEAAHPRWDQPAATDTYSGGTEPVGYWPVTGWAYARTGNQSRAQTGANNIRTAAKAASRPWPYTTASAGQLITLGSSDTRYMP